MPKNFKITYKKKKKKKEERLHKTCICMFSDCAPSGSMYNCFYIRLTVRHKLTGFPPKPTLNACSSISLIEDLALTSEMDSTTLFYPENTKTFLFRLFRDVWEGEESSKKSNFDPCAHKPKMAIFNLSVRSR